MDKREEIVGRLNALDYQRKEVRKELEVLDYESKLAESKKYEGKYYKTIEKFHPQHFRCAYVYTVCTESCEPKAIEISYWADKYDWFNIENEHNFRLRGYDDDEDTWTEITKEEFDEHYSQVHDRINKTYMTNDPTFGTKK